MKTLSDAHHKIHFTLLLFSLLKFRRFIPDFPHIEGGGDMSPSIMIYISIVIFYNFEL